MGGAFLALAAPVPAHAATITVTSTADTSAVDGAVTLREAIQSLDAGASVNADVVASGVYGSNDTIAFDIPGAGALPVIDVAAGGLPEVTKPVTIDGTTQPGTAVVELNGQSPATGPPGLQVKAPATIRGLSIVGFADAAISLDAGSDGSTISGDLIGIEPSANTIANAGGGIDVSSTDNTIGARDVISGNGGGPGVTLDTGASANVVEGDLIGTDLHGTGPAGNYEGVVVDGSANTIGGATPAARNVISGNTWDGIIGSGSTNTIEGNYVGTDVTGSRALPNEGLGVAFGPDGAAGAAAGDVIGGPLAGQPNVISGNGVPSAAYPMPGVALGGTGDVLEGNAIGTDAGGAAAIPNAGPGVADGGTDDQIGGATPGDGNLISGNDGFGVDVFAGAGATLEGNLIGTDGTGAAAVANLGGGVDVGASGATVGGSATFEGNLISGNAAGPGVLVSGSPLTADTVEGNLIGTDLAGRSALANAAGVSLAASALVQGNLISGNLGDGVDLGSETGGSVFANEIGEDLTFKHAVGNGGDGVHVNGAQANLIAADLVSANAGDGIDVVSGSANALDNDDTGLASDGTPLGNGGDGIRLSGSTGTTLALSSATLPAPVSAGNSGYGIETTGPGNHISATAVFGNARGSFRLAAPPTLRATALASPSQAAVNVTGATPGATVTAQAGLDAACTGLYIPFLLSTSRAKADASGAATLTLPLSPALTSSQSVQVLVDDATQGTVLASTGCGSGASGSAAAGVAGYTFTPPPAGGGPAPPPPVRPALRAARATARRLSFTLNEPATVRATFWRLRAATCGSRHTRCTRRTAQWSLTIAAHAGLNTAAIRRLPHGRYDVTITASAGSLAAAPLSVALSV